MESGEERHAASHEGGMKALNAHPHDNLEIRSLTTLEQFERCVVLQTGGLGLQ